MLSNLNKGRKSSEKVSFLKNVKIFLKAREDVLNAFKSNLFPIKNSMPDITPYVTPDKTPYVTHDTITRHTRGETSRLN